MRGFVPTPDWLVDEMVSLLFKRMNPAPGDYLLDAGCGDGAFIRGVLRWCRNRNVEAPRIVGVELHRERAKLAKAAFRAEKNVEIRCADFLETSLDKRFRFIISNPPFVGIDKLEQAERDDYRKRFTSARGRFDLYFLFMERAVDLLLDKGRMVFVTPEKWLYVEGGQALRESLSRRQIETLKFHNHDTFNGRVTYPIVTSIKQKPNSTQSKIEFEDGSIRNVRIREADRRSWLGLLNGHAPQAVGQHTLASACRRISVGLATGADSIFCLPRAELPDALAPFAFPTVAGRSLDIEQAGGLQPEVDEVMLVPYFDDGTLIPGRKLGALGRYLRSPENAEKLKSRTCVQRKPWYAFHDSVNLQDIRQPKILCKDISKRPRFWIDREGLIVPRHSVYYIIPRNPDRLEAFAEWLNGDEAAAWLTANCQRAANGYIRLQATTLRAMPVPGWLID